MSVVCSNIFVVVAAVVVIIQSNFASLLNLHWFRPSITHHALSIFTARVGKIIATMYSTNESDDVIRPDANATTKKNAFTLAEKKGNTNLFCFFGFPKLTGNLFSHVYRRRYQLRKFLEKIRLDSKASAETKKREIRGRD